MITLRQALLASTLALVPALALADAGSVVTTGGLTIEACAIPTISTGAYTSGWEVGGLIALNPAFRTSSTGAPDSGGVVQSVRLNIKSVQTAEFDLYEFSSNPSNTTWTDSTTPNILSPDAFKVRPPLKLTNNDSGLSSMTTYGIDGLGRGHVTSGATDYWIIRVIGTPTFSSTTGLQLCVTYWPD